MRSGDLDNTRGGRETEAMQEGSRLHRKIQRRMGSNYSAEVPLTLTVPRERDGISFQITLEGRADGIINNAIELPKQGEETTGLSQDEESITAQDIQMDTSTRREDIQDESIEEEKHAVKESVLAQDILHTKANEETDVQPGMEHFMAGFIDESEPAIIIDEIKCVYAELSSIQEMIPTHRAQAMCYAYMYAVKYEKERIGIQLTYCNMETEAIKNFNEAFSFPALKRWFENLIGEYCKWAAWQIRWQETRNASIKKLNFPFEYRPGQKDLVTGVYRSIIRDKKLFIEAPTGVGKTISTVFPTVKAMGEGKVSKIFYLTAKTITRTVAEETFELLMRQDLKMKVVTITAKDKICMLEKPDCNPGSCERAKGHFDRVNDAVFDMLTNETRISRGLIEEYATKHNVCPFEMCLDVTTWADAVICDYNYVFDPNVYLRRFFMNEKKQDYVFLIDEAHNLVERAREMYSAVLYKKDFVEAKKQVSAVRGQVAKQLEACNRDLLEFKRECDSIRVLENTGGLTIHLLRLVSELDEYFKEVAAPPGKDELLNLYFEVRQFLYVHDLVDENYMIYTDYDEEGEFRIKLLCMDPSKNLLGYLNKGKSAIFFSATLLPIAYYKEQLGGTKEDYAIYAPSPFESEKRLLMIGKDVSTKYTRRTTEEYLKIVSYIETFTSARKGNYFVFFPSYQMMNIVAELGGDRLGEITMQEANMTEEKKEAFLAGFEEEPLKTHLGFCVMGGIFSEGIDLKKDRLIGAVIVGTGLPQVCNERELFKNFYDKRNGSGFDHAYLYPGMNKVLQSAGRVIRTSEDKGAVLLLDERFLTGGYQRLFPREWYPHEVVERSRMERILAEFWNRDEEC
ncbi:MAG: ATP-dependent DNA helicase [Lachnospiraceae bacterium]|nr:ATP-dependent DNA helicase [Lachnospiraceae bacterium]